MITVRTGETALAMAEHFAFHKLRGDSPAVDSDKGCVSSRTVFVNQTRDQLLTGTRFPGNPDWCIGASYLAYHRAQGKHGFGLSNQSPLANQCGLVGFGLFASG